MDKQTPMRMRLESLLTIYKHDPCTVDSVINTWRSILTVEPWSAEALLNVAKMNEFNGRLRMLCAVTLMNAFLLEQAHESFISISSNADKITDRFEACTYLHYSRAEKFRQTIEENMLDIISSSQLSSRERYTMICKMAEPFIKSAYNRDKLRCDVDEPLVYTLSWAFFTERKNSVKDRILCAERLLRMDEQLMTGNDKDEIMRELLIISSDSSIISNTRADAADVVLRLGNEETQREARRIITALGGSDDVYKSSQSAHSESVNASAMQFIEKMILENGPLPVDDEEYNTVVNTLASCDICDANKESLQKALERVQLDSARFCTAQIDLKTLLVLVFRRIRASKMSSDLQNRLREELIDMSDTCSSGHLVRFANVFTAYENAVGISFEEQLRSNFAARMMSSMKGHPKKDYIMRGSADDADGDDKAVYSSFVTTTIPRVKKELYEEFVEGGHVDESKFEAVMSKCCEEW